MMLGAASNEETTVYSRTPISLNAEFAPSLALLLLPREQTASPSCTSQYSQFYRNELRRPGFVFGYEIDVHSKKGNL